MIRLPIRQDGGVLAFERDPAEAGDQRMLALARRGDLEAGPGSVGGVDDRLALAGRRRNGGLVALVGMVLRSTPCDGAYGDLLKEVGEQAERWASVERSTVVLDLIDLLSRHVAPDMIARRQLGYKLLEPLHRNWRLLEPDQVELAKLLADEIGVVFDWPQLASDEETVDRFRALELKLLLCSLNEEALSSTRQLLLEKAPRLKISLSSDHVGSPRLKQLTRNADVVVLATRAAKHAATAFIQDNAQTELVGFADGGGLASLHRKAVELLHKHTE